MIKRRLRLWIIILGVILVSSIFHIPSKSISLIAQQLLKYKYGLSGEWTGFKGGFVDGITLEGVRISNKDHAFLQCSRISSNIRFKDLIFKEDSSLYQISVEKPKITIKGLSRFQIKPLMVNTKIIISEGQLVLEDSNNVIALKLDNLSGEVTRSGELLDVFFTAPGHLTELSGEIDLGNRRGILEIVNGRIELPLTGLPPIVINGGMLLDKESIKIERGMLSLDELELEVGGAIFADRTLDLELRPGFTESRFLVMGSLDKPLIATNWGILETVFQIEGTQYKNGRLIFPRLAGEIRLPGFGPLELEGKLILGTDFIGLEDIILARMVNINGVVSRHRESRLKLWVEDIKGADLADQLPEVLKSLISPHTVNARLSVYGRIDNLQGGGILKLFSYPIRIACRYRHNRFSFRSIGEGPLGLSGSINLGKEPDLKIKGDFHNMNIVDLMSFFNRNVDPDWGGIVDGEFRISGELNDPSIRAKLEIEEGEIGNMKFDVAYINLDGTGKKLNLRHSMVYYKEIPAELTGYIDPRGKGLFDNINIKPTLDSFTWKGLNIVRDTDGKTVIFGQDVNENISVHFRSPLSSDPEGSEIDSEAEVEVEYKLLEDKSILIKMEEDEGTVGIEHKVKF